MAASTATRQTSTDYSVPSPGTDGISSLAWSPTEDYLVSTNWDGSIRFWECASEEHGGNRQIQAQPKALVGHEDKSPVLSSTFSSDGGVILTGGTDNAVRMWNLRQPIPQNGIVPKIGFHDAPVKSVAFLPSSNLVVSGGWDKKVKFWDARQPNPACQKDLPERCYDLDVRGDHLAVACASRKVVGYDVSGLPVEMYHMESPLKFQSRCVAVFPDSTGFCLGSIGGKVAIERRKKSADPKGSFTYRCHRREEKAFSINSICFHSSDVFATAGSDGTVGLWNKATKTCITKDFVPAVGGSISCASFNKSGNMFAYASSYDWSKGCSFYDPGKQKNEIFIHYTTEQEVTAKQRANTSSRRPTRRSL